MSTSLNAITAPDSYSPAATIDTEPIQRVIIDVANQPIYWNLKLPAGGGGNWDGTETYMLPGSRVILEPCVGVRIRAAIPAAQVSGNQAIVTIRAVSQ